MTDHEALLKAVSLLTAVSSVAGGYVSRSQRAEIADLVDYTKDYRQADLIARGWVREGKGWALHG